MAEGVAHVLEMMHPMREPPQPDSLAPALTALAVGCLAGVALVVLVVLARRRAALRRSALAALARTRRLAPAERLAAQAAVLRRLVRRLDGDAAARRQGATWLATLDEVFETRIFTQGVGAAFGDALYGRTLPDVEALDAALASLFGTLKGRRASAPAARAPSIELGRPA